MRRLSWKSLFTCDEALHRLAIAADLMTTELIVLTPEDDLHTALEKFNQQKLDELPVVSAADPGLLLGTLRRRDIGRADSARLADLRLVRSRNS